MQRAKLFGALLAYVNNIQITWKTLHLSVFCRTNSRSTDQSRAEGNNKECVGKKRFNGRVLPTGFGKSMCYVHITWKTIHLSVFCRTNSPSTDQSRADGNNTECVGKKRFNGRVLPTASDSACVTSPLFGQGTTSFFSFLWLSVIHYCC